MWSPTVGNVLVMAQYCISLIFTNVIHTQGNHYRHVISFLPMERESRVLLQRVQYGKRRRSKKELAKCHTLLLKLQSGVKQFDTVLKKTHKVKNIFALGRGRSGSVAIPLVETDSLCIPLGCLSVDMINKLSHFHKLSHTIPLESRLYQLIQQNSVPLCQTKNEPLLNEKKFSDCILMDHEKKRALFIKDSETFEKLTLNLGRLLCYKAKLPKSIQKSVESEISHMKERIDTFCCEVNTLSLL